MHEHELLVLEDIVASYVLSYLGMKRWDRHGQVRPANDSHSTRKYVQRCGTSCGRVAGRAHRLTSKRLPAQHCSSRLAGTHQRQRLWHQSDILRLQHRVKGCKKPRAFRSWALLLILCFLQSRL